MTSALLRLQRALLSAATACSQEGLEARKVSAVFKKVSKETYYRSKETYYPTICGLLRAYLEARKVLAVFTERPRRPLTKSLRRPKKCQKKPIIGAKETYYMRTFESLPAPTIYPGLPPQGPHGRRLAHPDRGYIYIYIYIYIYYN